METEAETEPAQTAPVTNPTPRTSPKKSTAPVPASAVTLPVAVATSTANSKDNNEWTKPINWNLKQEFNFPTGKTAPKRAAAEPILTKKVATTKKSEKQMEIAKLKQALSTKRQLLQRFESDAIRAASEMREKEKNKETCK